MSETKWVKAIVALTTPGGRFIKPGEKFQLEPGHEFSDKSMEYTDAPEDLASDPKYVKAEHEKAVIEHEAQDKVRQGKFSVRSVPRTDAVKADAKVAKKRKGK